MTRMFVSAQTFLSNVSARAEQRREESADKGATMVEYALLVGGIAALIAGLLVVFGPALQDKFDTILN